jgi:[protein-PII] uridylyltransferase
VRAFTTPWRSASARTRAAGRTVLELVAADRPGLLYRSRPDLPPQRVDVRNARIMTVGERAEDVFYVTTVEGDTLSAEQREQLARQLKVRLDQPASAA